MDGSNLLIADSSGEFARDLAAMLESNYHAYCCTDGRSAMELMRSVKPDILVLDLMLPGLDGITLLQMAAQEGFSPKVLASTSLYNDYVLQSAQELGVAYLMRQPCDVQAAALRVKDLHQRLHIRTAAADAGAYVGDILTSLSLLAKHSGFRYVRECILQTSVHPGRSVTKVLYPEVAELFGTGPNQVEHSIRTALVHAWDNRDPEIWGQYFPGSTRRPSNAVFIARMAELLR